MSEKIKIGSNRGFGIVFFIVFVIIGIYPLIDNGELRLWSILLSLIFLTLGLINSNFLTPLNILWFKFGIFLGNIISPIVMGIVFFLVVTPTGLIMRFLRKDILKLKNNSKDSYWIDKDNTKSSMRNQF